MMTDADKKFKPLLYNRNFILFLITRSCNVIGVQIVTVAVGWYVYQLTRDPLDLGYIGLAQFAPSLALFLVAGYVSDKYDRRMTIVVSNVIHLVVVFLLLGVSSSNWGGIKTILLILVIHGIARTFFHTAAQAILPNIVASDVFPNAVAYSSSVNKAAQLIGPALGGVLLALSEDWAYYVAGFSFLLAVCASIVMKWSVETKVCGSNDTDADAKWIFICLAKQSCFGRSLHRSLRGVVGRCYGVASNLCERYFRCWARWFGADESYARNWCSPYGAGFSANSPTALCRCHHVHYTSPFWRIHCHF